MKNKSVWPAVRIAAALLLFAGAGAIAFFLQSRSFMRDQINPVTWGKVPGDEFDPVRILF